MSNYLPVVVVAPGAARERLSRSDVLPQHLFRDIAGEQLWEEHSSPAIYLWPYDIPYSSSNELCESIAERVGDVPAFFGMDPGEPKDHQERMLSRILFGSVVVHILFLDNRKTDTTPGYEERNETYAQFCTFSEIIQWSRNLKRVMDVRFLNTTAKSHHILVIISCDQQVIVSQKEIDELNNLIGKSTDQNYKPFSSCYFLDLNLSTGDSGKIFHSKYIWDVMVSRFLLALLLSQEEFEGVVNPVKLWEKNGIKVWRASDCTLSVKQDASQVVLKKALKDAFGKLQALISSEGGARTDLLQDVSVNTRSLDYELEPRWQKKEPALFKKWAEKQNASWSFSMLSQSFFHNWSDLPVSEYKREIELPEHWRGTLEKLGQKRMDWSMQQPPADYTSAVQDFFLAVRSKPGELGLFINQLFGKIKSTHETLTGEHPQCWEKIVAAEKARQEMVKKLAEDTKEFQKARDYYVGQGIALLVTMSVTAFFGWMIWQILGLFVSGFSGFLKIFLLAGMVFAGSAVAYVLMMMLHNFAGNRAAGKLLAECLETDRKMLDRDALVREMFFEGIKKRNMQTLQCVRFKTWLLAQRVLAILQTEMQPQLSSLLEIKDSVDFERQAADFPDPDHVRDAYLKLTRSSVGPLDIANGDWGQEQYFEEHITGNGEKSFNTLWKKELCSEDRLQAGYFPSKLFISKIRSFVNGLLDDIHHRILEKSIQSRGEEVEKDFSKFIDPLQTMGSDKSLLSATLPGYFGEKTDFLFINSSFYGIYENLTEGHVSEKKRYRSKLLERTRTAALFYQEFDVNFALKPIAGSEKEDSGQLTFKIVEKRTGGV